MRYIQQFLTLSTVLFFCLGGCKEGAIPDLNRAYNIIIPTTAPDSVFGGQEIRFEATIITEAGLNKIQVKEASSPFQLISGMEKMGLSGKNNTYEFVHTPTIEDQGKVFNWVIVAFDNEGHTKSVPYTFKVIARPINTTIKIPTQIPASVNAGATLDFDFEVNAPDGIAKIEAKINGVLIIGSTKTIFDNEFIDNYNFNYLTSDEVSGNNVITIEVTDKFGGVKSAPFSVNVIGLPKPVYTYSNINLGAQNSTIYGAFIDLELGTVYTIANAKANSDLIDLLSFHSSNTGAAIAVLTHSNSAKYVYSPSAYPNDFLASWAVQNDTELKKVAPNGKVTAANFSTLTDEKLILEAFNESGTSTDNYTSYAVGDVFSFKTVGGKIGVILIKKKSTGLADYQTIDIKVQK